MASGSGPAFGVETGDAIGYIDIGQFNRLAFDLDLYNITENIVTLTGGSVQASKLLIVDLWLGPGPGGNTRFAKINCQTARTYNPAASPAFQYFSSYSFLVQLFQTSGGSYAHTLLNSSASVYDPAYPNYLDFTGLYQLELLDGSQLEINWTDPFNTATVSYDCDDIPFDPLGCKFESELISARTGETATGATGTGGKIDADWSLIGEIV